MAARLATDEGQALYKRRGAIVEPAFAEFLARLGRHVIANRRAEVGSARLIVFARISTDYESYLADIIAQWAEGGSSNTALGA